MHILILLESLRFIKSFALDNPLEQSSTNDEELIQLSPEEEKELFHKMEHFIINDVISFEIGPRAILEFYEIIEAVPSIIQGA